MFDTIDEIQDQVQNGEDSRGEFKEIVLEDRRVRSPNTEAMAGEMVAFANAEGGVLFLGVSDSGVVRGIPEDRLADVETGIVDIATNNCDPPIRPIVRKERLPRPDDSDATVMLVEVRRGLYVHRTSGGRYYIRVGSTKRDLTATELARHFQQRGRLFIFDEQPVPRERAIHGFAPVSTGGIPPHDDDRYDALICTDVLAEGMNLQQCRNIINYDLPWNPMRLVQRHGRVDRIGSIHSEVYLRTFFPDAQLDGLLNLEGRVRRKLALAAASVGVEDAPILDGASGDQSFAETREEIEKLHRGDASLYERGGTEGAAQTGEEYRQELRRALERHGDAIERLPWRIGSGMVRADHDGFVFCARVADRIYLRFVPRDQGQPIVSEIGTCLRFLECSEETPRHLPDSGIEGAYEAWQRAREDILHAWAYETDPANLQPKIRRLNRDVADFLRLNPPSEVEFERLHTVLDAIEAPWSIREERQLRTAWERDYPSVGAKGRALVEEVERIGVEPHHAPEPLPPIETVDVNLICWMALVPSK